MKLGDFSQVTQSRGSNPGEHTCYSKASNVADNSCGFQDWLLNF